MQHSTELAEKWATMSFDEQMSNIGAEVERALKWKQKSKQNLSHTAFFRCLELIDLSRKYATDTSATLKELSRLRESLCDYFYFENTYATNPEKLSKYFYYFNLTCNKNL